MYALIKHYLKIAIRNIVKDKSYSLVNILGLSIAITCCFLLVFWIKFELSFEDCYPNSDRIYKAIKVEKRADGLYRSANFRPPIVDELKAAFPKIQIGISVSHEQLPFVITGEEANGDGIMVDYATTSIDFLRMFFYEYVEGSPESVEKNRGCIMSEETARKFFGDQSAIGKTIYFGNGFVSCTIEAVVKMPSNTHIRFDLLDPFRNSQFGGQQYIMVKENTKFSPEKLKRIKTFLSSIQETEDNLVLQPIKDIHLNSAKELAINTTWETYGNKQQIYLFSLAAFLILVIAVINYINTSVARALNRMKEVGVRKVTGSDRKHLIIRFLIEAFIISIVSALIALASVKLLFPDFSEIMGNKISFDFDAGAIFITLLFCIIVSLLSGGYAAFYLSSFSPVKALKGGSQTGSKDSSRKMLIGFQFFLSVAILTCTIFMYKQINDIYTADTGVDKNNIIIIESGLWYEAEDFITVIKRENPNVIDATIATNAPYNASWGYSGISWEGSDESVKSVEFTEISCDHHYANTFGLQVLDGEFIPSGLSWWQDTDENTSYNLVINESFKKMMGEENPVGITVTYGWGRQGNIIGVVKDFNFKPLREKITPLIISFNPEASSTVFVKTTGKDKQATMQYILSKYKEMKPGHSNRPVMFRTVEQEYNKMYEVELRTAKILAVFSVISFLLSLLGIVSMISFMIEKRTKEIAIRKINGAGMLDIIRLFIREFSLVAIVASVLAIPLCFLIMKQWLQGYIYRTDLSWWIFICIPLLIMLLTALVMSIQIFFTARRNPVESLRSE